MTKNPIPLILIVFLLKDNSSIKLPQFNTLQLDATLDNIKNILATLDKVNNISSNIKSLPTSNDLSQLMQMAGPMISALTANNND